jgi:hypothetical protein
MFQRVTRTISNHTLASEEATYSGNDAKSSCGWDGCVISFSESELDIMAIYYGGLAAFASLVAYFLGATIFGGVVAAIVAIIFGAIAVTASVLVYKCGSSGGWMGIGWSGFTMGCNPVPWYY